MTRQEYYEKYDAHVKLNREAKHRLENLVGEIVNLLRGEGISCRPGAEPMSDVSTMTFRFPSDGVFTDFGLDISPYGSCYTVVAMEPEPGTEAEKKYTMCEEGRVRTP